MIFSCGDPHMDIHMGISIYPYGYPHMDIHMGIPTEILWEWDGSGSGNSLPTATLIILHYFYSLLTIFVRAI